MNKKLVKKKEGIKIVHSAKHSAQYLLISYLSMTGAGSHRDIDSSKTEV